MRRESDCPNGRAVYDAAISHRGKGKNFISQYRLSNSLHKTVGDIRACAQLPGTRPSALKIRVRHAPPAEIDGRAARYL